MDTFGLKIIASDGVFYAGRCQKLTIPAPDGEKGILAHHENMVIAVTVGIARMNVDGKNSFVRSRVFSSIIIRRLRWQEQ